MAKAHRAAILGALGDRKWRRSRAQRRSHAMIDALEARRLLAMPTLWTAEGPGGGGSVILSPVIAPNGQDLWATSDMNGIFHSSDFGNSWQLLNSNSGLGGLSGGTLSQMQFTSDPNVLYITSARGPVKSTDNGTTWTPLSGWSNGSTSWMAADLSTTTKILVSNGTNLYVSSNGGSSFTIAYASSNLFVAGAFFDGSDVYVGSNKGLLVSSNGGTTFALAAQQPANTNMMSFTGAKQGSTVRLLALTTNSSSWDGYSPADMTYNGLYRLDIGGSWVDKTSAVAAGQAPHFVSMAQNNISIVYAGGGDPTGRPQVLKSTDGGNTWVDTFFTSKFDVTPNVPNANVATGYEGQGGDFDWSWGGSAWGFSVCRADANKAIISECFVHITSDGGATWRQAYENPTDSNPAGQYTPQHKAYRGSGFNASGVHDLTWTSSTNIMASYTDIEGWRSSDGGSSWSHPTYNGVVVNTLYKTEYVGGLLYGATSNVHDMYQASYLMDSRTNPSYQTGAVVVSADQGATWSSIHSFGVPVAWVQSDPNNANRMYACAVDGIGSGDAGAKGGIWVTNNLNAGAASTWAKLVNPPRTEGHPYILRVLNDGTLVATYSGRRSGVVFTDSSGVFVSTDGGSTWIDRSDANMHWYTKEITIDPTDPTQNTWYVGVYNGWGGTGNDRGDVYRTTNRGLTWARMNLQSAVGAVTSVSIQSVTINPATREMYVATEGYGILYAPDVTVPGFSASNFSDVLSFPFYTTERVFINPYNSQDVWVATVGGGIIRGGVAPSALSATAISSTRIDLTWADNSGNESGFAIDRATDAGFTQNLVTTTAGVNATSATVTGLNPVTCYYFRIRATNSANKSANSGSASATSLSSNQTPTDIALSSTSILGNQPVGTAVGALSTADPDTGDTFTYSLVSGSGGSDNASFTISGNTLQTAAIFDYGTKSSYSIRLRSTDRGGLSFEKVFTITVIPSVMTIPDANLLAAIGSALGKPTGDVSGEDMAGLTSLAAASCGIGDLTGLEYATNLQQLDLRGNQINDLTPLARLMHLREVNVSYNDLRVTPGSYSLYVIQRWIDLGADVTCLPQNANQQPVDLNISGNRVAADQPAGTRVGRFFTSDADGEDDFTYTLVAGTGDDDNAAFYIDGDTLRTAELLHFNFGTDHYSIRVRTTDHGGLTFEKEFAIRMAEPIATAGQWGGAVLQVVTRGTTAYMCQGQSLVVMDVSQPSAPRDVGRVIIPEVAVDGTCGTESLAVAGNDAYVAVGDKGLVVIDISTPTAPRLVRKYDTHGFLMDVSVVGRYAYLVEDGGLEIIDITRPFVPGSVSWFPTTDWIDRVDVVGDYAYVGGRDKLQVIDISNPTRPVWVGACDLPGQYGATDLSVVGKYAYVADAYDFAVIDISTPASPVLLADYKTVDLVCAVSVVGNYVCAADSYYGLELIDVSRPSAPVFVGGYDTAGYAWGISAESGYAYVADFNSGLQVIDISTASRPTLAGEYKTAEMADHIQVVGSYAYVADGNNGLMVMDVSEPSFPRLAGIYKTPGQAMGLSVVGNYAYIAESYSGLEVIDVSNPAAPVLAGRYATPGEAWDVSVVGDYAYVVDTRRLMVLDVRTPSSPVLLGQLATGSVNIRNVSVAGHYAYVVDGQSGLEIVDISVPSDPRLVGMNSEAGYFNEGAGVVGNYAYVAAGSDGLGVIDISVPSAPTLVGHYLNPAWLSSVSVSGGYLYASVVRERNLGGGMLVFDITTPSAPLLVGSYYTAGYSYGVSVVGDYAYIADNWNGMCIAYLENQVPEDIALVGTTVAADSPAGTAVGSVYAFDSDSSDAFTYALVDGAGSDDNALFSISGNSLLTAQAASGSPQQPLASQGNHPSGVSFGAAPSSAPAIRDSYSVRVRATDQGGLYTEKIFTIAVSDANEMPIDVSLSNASVAENQAVGTVVGVLSSSDPDAGDTVTYSLVSGLGSDDNASFSISDDQLLTNASFDYEAKSSYSIRVRATDQGGLWFEKEFTVNVTDVDEIAPTVTAVYVRGSTWNANYLAFLAANTSGSSSIYGYAIPTGSGNSQLQTLPWRNLNRISVAFSEDVSIAQAQMAIVGSVGSYSVSGFSYNSTDHVATWSLSAVIGPDKLYVAIPGSGSTPVKDIAGNVLDGEWNNPTSYSQVGSTNSFPSGNGTAGGDFAFRLDVLPGDSTGGSLGKVNVADIAQTKTRNSLPVSLGSYRSDFDGNNLVNVADIAYVKSRSGTNSLPATPPLLPAFGPLFSQVSLLLKSRSLKLW